LGSLYWWAVTKVVSWCSLQEKQTKLSDYEITGHQEASWRSYTEKATGGCCKS